MKEKKYLSIFIIILIVSCDGDFLNKAPVSNLSKDNFYNTEKDLTQAVDGVYASLQSGGVYGQDMACIPEVRSDNAKLSWMQGNRPWTDIINFIINTSNSVVADVWDDSYQSIQRSNVVLANISNADMNQDRKNRYTGEVKFIRALNYFNLVRLFGKVPVILKQVNTPEEGYNYVRKPVEAVYEQIIKDLQEAEQVLPATYPDGETGRATKGAAKALAGKVYLTIKNYSAAQNELEEVIDMGIYKLLNNYADLWDPKNGNSSESIFEVQYKKGGLETGSPYSNLFAPKFSGRNIVAIGSADGYNSPSESIANAYEPNDSRKNISMASGYTDQDGEFISDAYTKKYLDTPFQDNDSENNWIVLRYADVLLMYAEVLNEINNGPVPNAYEMINHVRKRAGLAPLSGLNYESFSQAVQHERRVELAFEGHRWFDLIRKDRAVETMNELGYSMKKYQTLLPIPQSEIDVNPDNIEQNTGY